LQWAADNGCRVVNLSLGMEVRKGTASDPVFDTALAKAVAANLLVVAAGGNHSQRASGHTAPVQEPANSADALAVGAVDAASVIAEFSPAGLNGSGGEVNLVAPGVTVRSACANGAVIGTDYTNFSFTSYATPFVTGIAALWLEKDPTLSVAQLWQRLESTAKPLGSNIDFGAGLVQAP
jgi:subtilisin family serine protease